MTSESTKQMRLKKTLPRWIIPLAVAGLGVLVFLCLVIFSLPGLLHNLLLPPGPKSSGPSASLGSMLALADTEAAATVKNAELLSVDASAPDLPPGTGYGGPLTGSLKLNFTYYMPNDESFWVEFEDAAPKNTLSVSSPGGGKVGEGSLYDSAKEKKSAFRKVLVSTKISPREAVQLTWGMANKEAERLGLQTPIFKPIITTFGHSPVVWEVDYWADLAQGPGTPTVSPSLSGAFASMDRFGSQVLIADYSVDLITGKIIDTTKHADSTPAPTP